MLESHYKQSRLNLLHRHIPLSHVDWIQFSYQHWHHVRLQFGSRRRQVRHQLQRDRVGVIYWYSALAFFAQTLIHLLDDVLQAVLAFQQEFTLLLKSLDHISLSHTSKVNIVCCSFRSTGSYGIILCGSSESENNMQMFQMSMFRGYFGPSRHKG